VHAMNDSEKTSRPVLTFAILSGLFALSMFYRGSNAVIAPNLVSDLGLTAESLGMLGGAYFFCFALLQIPTGPILDTIGPRLVITACAFIGALGGFLFAAGQSFGAVFAGRLLIGVGMASMFMGPLKVYSLKFPPDRFGTLMGLTVSVGTLGTALAASPLAYFTRLVGWRIPLALAGVASVLLGLACLWVLTEPRKNSDGRATRAVSASGESTGIRQSLKVILGSLSFWQMGVACFFRYGTFVSMQGLWLAVYLMDVKEYSPVEAGLVLIILSVGYAIGNPLAGRLSDRSSRSRKTYALWGMSGYCLSLAPLTGILPMEHPFWYGLTAFFIGLTNASGNLIYAHVKELYPVTMSGTALTWLNFFTVSGGGFFMAAMGKIIDLFPHTGTTYPPSAYHLTFAACAVATSFSVILYAFTKREK